ncbi:P-loop containing nucleoside triphosphate hydrolase protein [Xylariaceae sp. AK1471]|nr:P-loop containing nucleoside triphosphate hydrolase protein [Xylariaceae sp. AK1471]
MREYATSLSRTSRGWTPQELIAPVAVEFYSREGIWLGDKKSLEPQLCDITGIPASALRGTPLSNFTIVEREAWVRNRQTKYEEDMAYSLLGIFDVHMPLIYGEGRQKAERRLREEAQKVVKGTRHNDFSITFSLSEVPDIQHFVAREGELAEMRRTLSSDGSRRVVVLQGLGGIGKTQLAITYAKRHKDEYSAIFCRLSALDLQQNHEEVVKAVKAWFSLPGNTRWLLVYDNFDDPKLGNGTDEAGIDIGRFLPEAYQGSVIVTTRSSRVTMGHPTRIKKLESINDSLQILATTSGRGSVQYGKENLSQLSRALITLATDVDAKSLVKELDGLPLALATAGAYLRRVSISFANYLRLYRESWARLHTSTPRLGSYQDRTLCSTWQLSYVQIQEQDPLAAHLLRWWAYFDNEDIWFELLQPNGADGPAWIYELADKLNFNSAMGTLHDYGFVEPHISTLDLIGSRGYSIRLPLQFAFYQDRQERTDPLGARDLHVWIDTHQEFGVKSVCTSLQY